MSENVAPFEWNAQREQVATLLAEGELTDDEIGDKVGISSRQITRWKTHPEFKAKVESISAELGDAMLKYAIARRVRRVKALDARQKKMLQVIDERSTDPKMADVPGGVTGLIVHDVKGVGKGEDYHEVDIYSVDVPLLRELREHEKQAAMELGQWAEKRELTGKDGGPMVARTTLDLGETVLEYARYFGLVEDDRPQETQLPAGDGTGESVDSSASL
jgi:hypothetical protein